MTRGTTPTIELSVSGVKLTMCKSLFITLQQNEFELTKNLNEGLIVVDDATAKLRLSQEETLCFKKGHSLLQIRGIANSGDAFATKIATVSVADVLFEEVIE